MIRIGVGAWWPPGRRGCSCALCWHQGGTGRLERACICMRHRGHGHERVRGTSGPCCGEVLGRAWNHSLGTRLPYAVRNCINDERGMKCGLRAGNWYPSYLRSATQLAPFPHHIFWRGGSRRRRGGKRRFFLASRALAHRLFFRRIRANRSKLSRALYLTQTAADRAAVIPCAACAARRRRAACTSSTHSHVTFMPLARLSDD